MLQFLAMHVSSVSLVLRITPAPRFAWRWIGQVDRRAMGEQETGGCRFIEHCPLLAHGTIPCIWLKQYCLQTSIDLNSFRFQFAVSLMALKMLALILPVVLAVIPDPDWQAFKNKFQKSYASQNEEVARYKLFVETQARVKLLNKLNGEAVFGITWMADRFDEEKYKRGLRKPKNFVPTAPVRNSSYLSRTSHASAVDWRLTEAVTPIKNQGQCGSCWAFSATEAVESQLIMASGGRSDIELSPQQITSCSPSTGTYGCQGCNGGFTEGAYEYLKTAPGLANSFLHPVWTEPDRDHWDRFLPQDQGGRDDRSIWTTLWRLCTGHRLQLCNSTLHWRWLWAPGFERLGFCFGRISRVYLCERRSMEWLHRRCSDLCGLWSYGCWLSGSLCHGGGVQQHST